MKALVVGGTGPTGPFIVNGLLKRGYKVTIFHRGSHELDEIPPEVEHIHGDPHFRETIEESLRGRDFDLTVATYGRMRYLAEAMVGRTGRFVAVGGTPSYRGCMEPQKCTPVGMRVPTAEDGSLVESEEEHRFSYLIRLSEITVLKCHPTAAVFRYPRVYGPHQLLPLEWCVIRRILDKRPYIILPDGGLTINTMGYAENLAHGVLLAIDKPEKSAGQIYNCGDEQQLAQHQWVEVIARAMNYDLKIVSMPFAVARPAKPLNMHPNHRVLDLSKIKSELGYRDLVPAEEALKRTVDWYVKNPLERGGQLEHATRDSFNYEGEDRLVVAFNEGMQRVAEVPFDAEDRPHPYAHPKKAGEKADHFNR